MTRLNFRICSLLIALATGIPNCGAAERLYVAFPRQIMTFDKAGTLLNSFSVANRATDIAVDKWGSVYVLSGPIVNNNMGLSIVTKYDATGNLLGEIISRVSANNYLLGLAIKNDAVLYAGVNGVSGGDDSVARYSVTGNHLGEFAKISTPSPGAPFALAFDRFENMYVPDHDLIERFDALGKSLGTFASIPSAPPNDFIVDLTIDSADYVYASTFEHKVYRFSPTGTEQTTIDTQFDTSSIAIDSLDILFAAGGGSGGKVGQIKTFQADGTPIGIFATNLPDLPLDMAFATIVPEPSCLLLAAIGTFFTIVICNRA